MVSDFRAFHLTCIGASHGKSGRVCQDYSESGETPDCCLAVVCDGHGGEEYFRSDRGSRLAAEIFSSCVADADFLQGMFDCPQDKQRRERLAQLIKSIIVRWHSLVDEDIQANPFSAEELQAVSEKARTRYLNGERLSVAYGTTLVGAVITDSFWFGIQIGDGRCVAVSEQGDFTQPIPWDDTCFLNVTTSLCDEKALGEFRLYVGRDMPAAVFLGSDGIDDCFAGDEKLYDFYRVMLKSFAQTDAVTACEQLRDYLPVLSQKGSGDDMSVAMLLRQDFPCTWEAPQRVLLHITRDGNFGGDKPNDDYYQEAEIEAVPGRYCLDEWGCDGFHAGVSDFEIVTVSSDAITLRIKDSCYTITPETGVQRTDKDIVSSYDGPKFVSYDTLAFRMTGK